MKQLILLLVVALVMFTGAAAASWWWQQKQHAAGGGGGGEQVAQAAHAAHASATPSAVNAAASTSVRHAGGGTHSASSGHVANSSHAVAATPAPPPPEGSLPIAVRSRPMSVEELVRLGLSLNARNEALEQRESEFREREARLKLALVDLQGEQAAIDSLRSQVQKQLEAADTVIARIQHERQELSRDQAEAKAAFEKSLQQQSEFSADELTNIKKMATWVRAMDPSKAGELLREMSNDGRMETAARILSHLEEREAARVLDALDDTALVDDLVQQYQNLRPQAKAEGKSR
jgi:flagellar basal body-associated protein FliL